MFVLIAGHVQWSSPFENPQVWRPFYVEPSNTLHSQCGGWEIVG